MEEGRGQARGRRRTCVRRARQGETLERDGLRSWEDEACSRVRLWRRALRWLPRRGRTRCGLLGRIAHRAEVAVEVAGASRRMSVRLDRVANPRNGAAGRELFRQIARGARCQSRRNDRGAIGRELGPRRARRTSGSSSAVRTLRATGDVEGESKPHERRSTHWAGRGRIAPCWMSTGRPRVMR